MNSESSALSKFNASTNHKKSSGKKTTRHPSCTGGVRRRKAGKRRSDAAALPIMHGEAERHKFPDSGGSLRPPASSTLRVATDISEASSSSPSVFDGENVNVLETSGGREVGFVDEEAMFNMPLMMDCMAGAMLLTPPALKKGFSWSESVDDDDDDVDFTLWGK